MRHYLCCALDHIQNPYNANEAIAIRKSIKSEASLGLTCGLLRGHKVVLKLAYELGIWAKTLGLTGSWQADKLQ